MKKTPLYDLHVNYGAKLVDFADLAYIKTPDRTETYIPVSHQELVTKIKQAGVNHYKSDPMDTKLEVNYRGQQMFGSMTFFDPDNTLRRSIGFRNSYDKTLPIGVCGGASVVVCSNLMFTGDVIKMRKHTQNVEEDLNILIQKLFADVDRRYNKSLEDRQKKEDSTRKLRMFAKWGFYGTTIMMAPEIIKSFTPYQVNKQMDLT